MNIALLFNSDDPKYGGSYGGPIRDTVFGLRIIQASQRHMKLSVGDVCIYGRPDYDNLIERIYFSGTWSILLEKRLRTTFHVATVYAVIFENMTQEIAHQIHSSLFKDKAYLGLIEVDYAYGPHLALFRNSMISLFRVQGTTCRVFYSMGEEDGKHEWEIEAMKKHGYIDIDHEDRGAHKTIFDDYDSLSHFKRVAKFRDAVSPFLEKGADDASELVMVLEDLNPRLFNALGAAVDALSRAENEEDAAQAAISGRRYLEQLADALFPPRVLPFNGRKVARANYRNRIWAFIEENCQGAILRVKAIGSEVDRLDKEFNAGLHGSLGKERVAKAFANVSAITAVLLALNPTRARQPYLAHRERMIEFFKDSLGVDLK